LEREVLPARVDQYVPALLDTLVSAGEVTWLGVEPLGERDGRIALYLTDQLPLLVLAASRRKPWMPCGTWSGRAWSPTTRCTRCAPTRPARSGRGVTRGPGASA